MLNLLIIIVVVLGLVYAILVKTKAICSVMWCRPLAPIELGYPRPSTKVCKEHPLTGSVKAGVEPVIIIDAGKNNVYVQDAVGVNAPNRWKEWWNVTMIGRNEWSVSAHFGEKPHVAKHFTVLGFVNPINKEGKPIDPKALLEEEKNIGREPSVHEGRFLLGTFERKDC